MNLSQLEYFDAACRHESVTEAAQELCVTQQAVSAGLGALERELGIRLLERGATGVRPTANGRKLLHNVHTALNAIAQIKSQAVRLRDNAHGVVSLAYATCTIGTDESRHPNQAELAMFSNGRSNVTLRLFEAASDACLALIDQGTVDVALVAGQPDLSKYSGTFLHSPELVLCVPVDHPFTARNGTLSYSDLLGVPQFLPPDLNYSLKATDKACRAWGFKANYIEMLPSGGSQIDHVAAGKGVAFMPDGYEAALADKRVRLVHMCPEEACHVPLWLAWNRKQQLDTTAQALVAFLKGLFAQQL